METFGDWTRGFIAGLGHWSSVGWGEGGPGAGDFFAGAHTLSEILTEKRRAALLISGFLSVTLCAVPVSSIRKDGG